MWLAFDFYFILCLVAWAGNAGRWLGDGGTGVDGLELGGNGRGYSLFDHWFNHQRHSFIDDWAPCNFRPPTGTLAPAPRLVHDSIGYSSVMLIMQNDLHRKKDPRKKKSAALTG